MKRKRNKNRLGQVSHEANKRSSNWSKYPLKWNEKQKIRNVLISQMRTIKTPSGIVAAIWQCFFSRSSVSQCEGYKVLKSINDEKQNTAYLFQFEFNETKSNRVDNDIKRKAKYERVRWKICNKSKSFNKGKKTTRFCSWYLSLDQARLGNEFSLLTIALMRWRLIHNY